MRWTRSSSQRVAAVLRAGVSLLLALQIFYTPIHLAAEPHSVGVCFEPGSPVVSNPLVLDDEGRDGSGHHERHSAALHKLKVTQPSRESVAELAVALPVDRVEAPSGDVEGQGFAHSGLSPPEHSQCWQFLFRAALPARAPSITS